MRTKFTSLMAARLTKSTKSDHAEKPKKWTNGSA